MSNKREWTWNHHSEGQDGVHIEGDHLVWWSENWAAPFASGGACEQTFEAFLESGPVDSAIPQSDLEELRETVLAMGKAVVRKRRQRQPNALRRKE